MTDTIMNITEFIASLCAMLFFAFILIALIVFAIYVIIVVIFNVILVFSNRKR